VSHDCLGLGGRPQTDEDTATKLKHFLHGILLAELSSQETVPPPELRPLFSMEELNEATRPEIKEQSSTLEKPEKTSNIVLPSKWTRPPLYGTVLDLFQVGEPGLI